MKIILSTVILSSFLFISSCASPPKADPSKVTVECAQQCSSHLAECSSGFKLFPIVAQGQCNDTYDVCIKGCPLRSAAENKNTKPTTSERLQKIDSLFKSGIITQEEYNKKRQAIIDSL
jgi:hypothetical protein